MRHGIARFGGPIAVIGLLAACASQSTVVTGIDYEGNYTPSAHLAYLSTGPDVETVVTGDLGADAEAMASAVAAALNAHKRGPAVVYTTSPAKEASPGYRMVMALGAGPINGGELCQAVEDGEAIDARGTTGLQAAFCYRERRIAEAFVNAPAFADASDPGLDQAVAVALNRVFPLTLQPDIGGNCLFC
jgi:hypothetical protein